MRENLFISPNLCQEVLAEQASVCKQRGFTLIELMIVILILGVLLALTTGSYTELQDRTRTETAAGELRSILTSARLVALSTGQSVYVTINYNSGSASVRNSIASTHLDGVYDEVNKKVTGNEKFQNKVYWFKASTASNGCSKAAAGNVLKTIEFTARSEGLDKTDGFQTASVVVSSDEAGTKNLKCLQVRQVTGRVVEIKS